MIRWLYVLVPLAALLGLIAWRINTKKAEAAAQTQQREMRMKAPAAVTVAPAQVRDVVQVFEGVGTVETPFNVKVASRISGRIDYVVVREGDSVTQGTPLVRINPADIQAEVQGKRAALAEAKSRLAQAALNQNPTNTAITTAIRLQEAVVASAEADYNQAVQEFAAQQASAEAAVTEADVRVTNSNSAVKSGEANSRREQANVENAKSKLRRAEALLQKGYVAEQVVDDARTSLSVASAALEVAQGQLGNARSQVESSKLLKTVAEQQVGIVKTKGKAQVEAARAKVDQAKATLESARANTAQKSAYQANLDALKSAVSAADADLRTAEARLSDTTLLAPLNGVVTGRYMDPGAMATPGVPILAVQSLRQVWVTVPIPEEVSRKVFVGMAGKVAFDALPGRPFAGKIVQINPSADPQSRQFAARITLENADSAVKPGMFGRVTIEVERVRNAVVVPREAVEQGKEGQYVISVTPDNHARHIPVSTGASDPRGIAITRGVQPGDKVVVLSASPLKDNQAVRVSSKAEATADTHR